MAICLSMWLFGLDKGKRILLIYYLISVLNKYERAKPKAIFNLTAMKTMQKRSWKHIQQH
jgi:hypothetical protein